MLAEPFAGTDAKSGHFSQNKSMKLIDMTEQPGSGQLREASCPLCIASQEIEKRCFAMLAPVWFPF
jgi:hypothetical protein